MMEKGWPKVQNAWNGRLRTSVAAIQWGLCVTMKDGVLNLDIYVSTWSRMYYASVALDCVEMYLFYDVIDGVFCMGCAGWLSKV